GAPDGNRTRQPLLDRQVSATSGRRGRNEKELAAVRRGGFAPPQPCGHGFTARWVRYIPEPAREHRQVLIWLDMPIRFSKCCRFPDKRKRAWRLPDPLWLLLSTLRLEPQVATPKGMAGAMGKACSVVP